MPTSSHCSLTLSENSHKNQYNTWLCFAISWSKIEIYFHTIHWNSADEWEAFSSSPHWLVVLQTVLELVGWGLCVDSEVTSVSDLPTWPQCQGRPWSRLCWVPSQGTCGMTRGSRPNLPGILVWIYERLVWLHQPGLLWQCDLLGG